MAYHPTLTDLLKRIMKQEGCHIDYYRQTAIEHLEDSPAAQRTTRRMLRALWSPVGAGVMPREETTHLVDTLLDGREGRRVTDRIDRRIDLLPGLEGLGLMAGAVEEYGSGAVSLDSVRSAVAAPARQRDVVGIDAKAS